MLAQRFLSQLRSYLPEIRTIIPLAIPIIVAQVLQVSMGFVDTLMVGRLGEDALAALAIASMVLMYTLMLAGGVLSAINPLVGEVVGKDSTGDDPSDKDPNNRDPSNRDSSNRDSSNRDPSDRAAVIALQGLALSALVSIPVLVVFFFAEPLLLLLRQSPDIARDASSYLSAVMWGIFPAIALFGLRAYLEGLMRPRVLMVITIVGVILNVIFNELLIFGHWGFPALGLAGAGWATCGVNWFMLVVAGICMHYHPKIVVPWQRVVWDSSIIRDIIRVGFPIAIALAAEGGMFSVSTLLMGNFGTAALAAQRIAVQHATLIFMVPLSIALVISARVASFSAQKDSVGVTRVGNVGILLALCFMSVSALCCFIKPLWVIKLYIDIAEYPEATQHAIAFLRIAALFMFCDGLQVACAGALRGLKDTAVPMVITLICYWLLGVGSGVLLAFFTPLAANGLWLGLTIGLCSAGIALLWRWRERVTTLEQRVSYKG